VSTREVRMPDAQTATAQTGEGQRSGAVETSQTAAAMTADIADPGPLGLAGFALTTFVLSVFNADIISNKGVSGQDLRGVVLPLALFYGGIAQLLAGMWEFKKANTFGALAFTSYGAFWISFAAYVKFILPGLNASPVTKPDAHTVTGLFLLAWTIFTLYMLVASLRVNAAVAAVFAVLTVTFIFLTWGDLSTPANENLVKIGGYLGIVTAFLAWYASAAGVINAQWKRVVLPVMPLK
jgi:succinate-acetate transporter protein